MTFWSSVGHVFASGYHDIVVAARAVSKFNDKLQPKEAQIEELTSLVPVYGIEAEAIERIAFACLGEFSAIVNASGGADQAVAQTKADPELLKQVEALMEKNPELVKKAAVLFKLNA